MRCTHCHAVSGKADPDEGERLIDMIAANSGDYLAEAPRCFVRERAKNR